MRRRKTNQNTLYAFIADFRSFRIRKMQNSEKLHIIRSFVNRLIDDDGFNNEYATVYVIVAWSRVVHLHILFIWHVNKYIHLITSILNAEHTNYILYIDEQHSILRRGLIFFRRFSRNYLLFISAFRFYCNFLFRSFVLLALSNPVNDSRINELNTFRV